MPYDSFFILKIGMTVISNTKRHQLLNFNDIIQINSLSIFLSLFLQSFIEHLLCLGFLYFYNEKFIREFYYVITKPQCSIFYNVYIYKANFVYIVSLHLKKTNICVKYINKRAFPSLERFFLIWKLYIALAGIVQ